MSSNRDGNLAHRPSHIDGNLSHRPSHRDGNLSHRPSHRDGNLSHRLSHAGVAYMKKSKDEEIVSSAPTNFWVPEPEANITTFLSL